MTKNIDDIDYGINLIVLIKIIWTYKVPIFLASFIFGAISVYYSLSLNNIYESKSLVYVDNDRYVVEESRAADQNTVNNFMAGRSYNSYQNATSLVLDFISSRKFLLEFVDKRNIKPVLMASKKWDILSQDNILNKNIYDIESNSWIEEPTTEMVYRSISDLLVVKSGRSSGLIEIGFKNINPYYAKKWTEWIILDLNAVIREFEIKESKETIEKFTSNQIETSYKKLNQTYNMLIESNIKNIMMASIQDYPLKIIDPPFVPDRKIRPRRSIISILGAILGGGTVMYVCLVRHFYFSKRKNDLWQ